MAKTNQNAPNALDGAKLKEIRKALSLSQMDFAESLDISQAALSYLESGETTMSLAVFKNLINVFNVNPWTFLSNATNEPLFSQAKTAKTEGIELKNKLVRIRKEADRISKSLELINQQF